jgi:hypothetical protein
MPKVGEEEFEYTPEGIAEAKAKSLETGIPMSNAQERSETYQLGGKVQPPTAPSMPQYDEGGKVKSKKINVTDVVKESTKRQHMKSYRSDMFPGGDKIKAIKKSKKKTKKMAKEILEK